MASSLEIFLAMYNITFELTTMTSSVAWTPKSGIPYHTTWYHTNEKNVPYRVTRKPNTVHGTITEKKKKKYHFYRGSNTVVEEIPDHFRSSIKVNSLDKNINQCRKGKGETTRFFFL